MADRTSAALFGEIFCMLAEDPTENNLKMAAKLYEKARQYDFSWCQMGCDEALLTLGLASSHEDEYGPAIIYKE